MGLKKQTLSRGPETESRLPGLLRQLDDDLSQMTEAMNNQEHQAVKVSSEKESSPVKILDGSQKNS